MEGRVEILEMYPKSEDFIFCFTSRSTARVILRRVVYREETSAYCTVNHQASLSNYQLSNMKHPARDSNRRPPTFADFYSGHVEQNCHVLVTTLYIHNIASQLIELEENLKYWGQKKTTEIWSNCKRLSHVLRLVTLWFRWEATPLFRWGELERKVLKSELFCTGDLPIYLIWPIPWMR